MSSLYPNYRCPKCEAERGEAGQDVTDAPSMMYSQHDDTGTNGESVALASCPECDYRFWVESKQDGRAVYVHVRPFASADPICDTEPSKP